MRTDRLVPAATWGGLGHRVTDDQRVIQEAGDRRELLRTTRIEVAGRSWKVEVYRGDRPSAFLPWSVLAVGLALSVIAFLGLVRLTRRWREAASAGERRAAHLDLLSQGGRALHHTLDLDELLPSFVAVVGDVVPVNYLSVRVEDASGSRETFRTGVPPPNEPLVIPLSRGWRTVGTLVLAPAGPLDGDDLWLRGR